MVSRGISGAKPITCRRQCNRPIHPAGSVSHCCKCSIAIHFLHYLNNELQQIFYTPNMSAFKGLPVVPYKRIRVFNKGSKLLCKEKVLCFANFYEDDMSNYISIPDELDIWEQSWRTFKGDHPNNVSATLKTFIPWIWKYQSGLKNSCNITCDLLACP